MTESAIAVILGLTLTLTLVTYFALYKILMLSNDLKDFINQQKEKNRTLFILSHLLIYLLSCVVLYGAMEFKRFIFD
jgi:hypothetical protein